MADDFIISEMLKYDENYAFRVLDKQREVEIDIKKKEEHYEISLNGSSRQIDLEDENKLYEFLEEETDYESTALTHLRQKILEFSDTETEK